MTQNCRQTNIPNFRCDVRTKNMRSSQRKHMSTEGGYPPSVGINMFPPSVGNRHNEDNAHLLLKGKLP